MRCYSTTGGLKRRTKFIFNSISLEIRPLQLQYSRLRRKSLRLSLVRELLSQDIRSRVEQVRRSDIPATTMSNEIEITVASPEDRLPVFRMLELYQHDLSDIWDQDLDVHGEYGYELDRFWLREEAWPYVFRVAGSLAGFALVDKRVRIAGDDFWLDQFFVPQ